MNFEKYTERARGFVLSAQSLALRERNQQFMPEHVLKVLLDDEGGLAVGLIDWAAGNSRQALTDVEAALAKLPRVEGSGASQLYMAPTTARLLDNAEKISQKAGDSFVTVERLLLALAMDKGSQAAKVLTNAGVSAQTLNAAINDMRRVRSEQSSTDSFGVLTKYLKDITKQVYSNQDSIIIGRDKEVQQLIEILSRRKRNNPALIGEQSIGHIEIVNKLSMRIMSDDIPSWLIDTRVVCMSKDTLRGDSIDLLQFEKNICDIISAISQSKIRTILFENELDVILERFPKAFEILTAAIESNRVNCITAMTQHQYNTVIRSHKSINYLFQPLQIDELQAEDAVANIRLIKPMIELHYGVSIIDEAILKAVTLSSIYIKDKFLPDKAIEVIDQAASRLRVELDTKPTELDELDRRIVRLKHELAMLREEGDPASGGRLKGIATELAELQEESDLLNERWKSEKNKIKLFNIVKKEFKVARTALAQAQSRGDYAEAGRITYGIIPEIEKRLVSYRDAVMEAGSRGVLGVEGVVRAVSDLTGVSFEDVRAGRNTGPKLPSSIAQMPQIERQLSIYIAEYVGEKYMGDKFENIQGSNTIVSRSPSSSVNIKSSKNDIELISQALAELSRVVTKSEDPSSKVIFDAFSDEMVKDDKDKGKLNKYWHSLVKLLPEIATVSEATTKLTSLFL